MISKQEYYALVGLLHLAHVYEAKVEDFRQAMAKIVGLDEHNRVPDWVDEAIWNHVTLQEALDYLDIEVEDGLATEAQC